MKKIWLFVLLILATLVLTAVVYALLQSSTETESLEKPNRLEVELEYVGFYEENNPNSFIVNAKVTSYETDGNVIVEMPLGVDDGVCSFEFFNDKGELVLEAQESGTRSLSLRGIICSYIPDPGYGPNFASSDLSIVISYELDGVLVKSKPYRIYDESSFHRYDPTRD